jgi:hypothetical protein
MHRQIALISKLIPTKIANKLLNPTMHNFMFREAGQMAKLLPTPVKSTNKNLLLGVTPHMLLQITSSGEFFITEWAGFWLSVFGVNASVEFQVSFEAVGDLADLAEVVGFLVF